MIGSSGVFFFGFSLLVKRSLFFVCNTTDSDEGNDEDDDKGDNNGDDNGDEDDKKLVDNQLDTVNPVDGDDFTRGGFDNLNDFFFSSMIESNDLPCLIFVGVSKIGLGFAMV